MPNWYGDSKKRLAKRFTMRVRTEATRNKTHQGEADMSNITVSIIVQAVYNVHLDCEDWVFAETVSSCTATCHFQIRRQECMDHCKMIISLLATVTKRMIVFWSRKRFRLKGFARYYRILLALTLMSIAEKAIEVKRTGI